MQKLFKILLIAAFINALSWVILIPVWEYPDEQAHFAQVQYMVEKTGIPYDNKAFDTSQEVAISEKILGTYRDDLGNNKFSYHPEVKVDMGQNQQGPGEEIISNLPKSTRNQMVKNEATLNPPLYYVFASLVYRIFSFGDLFVRVYAIRLLSVLFFVLNVFVAIKIGKLIFEKNTVLQITLPSVIAFTPMVVYSSTGILADPLTNLLFSIFVLISLLIIKKGISPFLIVVMVTTIILGSLTRQQFLITLFITPFVAIHQILNNSKAVKKLIPFVIISLGFLYVLSYFVGSLSFIRRLDFPESSGKNPNNPLFYMTFLDHFIWTVKHTVSEVWPWYWGVYKWLSLTLPPIVYQIINRAMIFVGIGIVLKTFFIWKNKTIKRNIPIIFLTFAVAVYFLALTVFDYFFRKNNGYSFGIQGRYFFPLITAQISLIIVGLWTLLRQIVKAKAKYIIYALILAFMIFNNYSLAFVSSSYYNTSSISSFVEHASQYKPDIIKGIPLLLILVLGICLQGVYIIKLGKFVHYEKVNFNESS